MLGLLNIRAVCRVWGALSALIGLFQLLCMGIALFWSVEGWKTFVYSISFCIALGAIFWWIGSSGNSKIGKREGYLVVTLGWVYISILSMLPYLFGHAISSVTDAFFESISGLTTTGASILTDIEVLPHNILLWRSMTQWIGGMGIIVLTVALFPLLGIGGFELFVAEAPGPTSEKISPRITDTAKILWFIYCCLTILLFSIYGILGMSAFEAINHALTTMATGGFSTKNSSMIEFSPAIQYVCTFFMFLAGCNYSILFFGFSGRIKKVLASNEFVAYSMFVILAILVITLRVHWTVGLSLEQSFRQVAFMVVSIITTTGYVSVDYTAWTPGLTTFFLFLLFIGACAGSTSGGIKVVRHLILFKNSILEFKRLLHPRAMIRIKLNKQLVPPKIITHILVFFLVYMAVFLLGTLVVSALGLDLETSIGAVATSLGNVGPGIAKVGPMDNFAWIPAHIKWILSFLMLVGRLELFSVLILFTTYFWRTN